MSRKAAKKEINQKEFNKDWLHVRILSSLCVIVYFFIIFNGKDNEIREGSS